MSLLIISLSLYLPLTSSPAFLGMTHSGLRESVSLFEGAPSLVAQNSRFSSYHNSADSSSGIIVIRHYTTRYKCCVLQY